MRLKLHLRLVRAIVAICCTLLVGVQIGAYTHALTHLSAGKAEQLGAELTGQDKDTVQLSKPGACDVCLSFGAVCQFLNWAPPVFVAPDSPDFIGDAVFISTAVLTLPLYRSRAPPALRV